MIKDPVKEFTESRCSANNGCHSWKDTHPELQRLKEERDELAEAVRKASSEKGNELGLTLQHSDGQWESEGILDWDSEVSESL